MCNKKLTPDQVDAQTMALAFVRALLLGTDKEKNKKNTHCPVVVWEDETTLDEWILPDDVIKH